MSDDMISTLAEQSETIARLEAELAAAKKAEHQTFMDAAVINVENDKLRAELADADRNYVAALDNWDNDRKALFECRAELAAERERAERYRNAAAIEIRNHSFDVAELTKHRDEARAELAAERERHETVCKLANAEIDTLRSELSSYIKSGAQCEGELAAERERADNAERREGNLRDHIVHLGQRLATLREALVRARPYVLAAGEYKEDFELDAAIDAVLKEVGGGDE